MCFFILSSDSNSMFYDRRGMKIFRISKGKHATKKIEKHCAKGFA